MTAQPITAAEAARQIGELINAKASSPSLGEMEAVIARVAPAPVAQPSPGTPTPLARQHALWRQAADAADAVFNDRKLDGDEHCHTRGAANDRLTDAAEAVCAEPVTDWSDLRLLAEVCFRELWPGQDLSDKEAPKLLAECDHASVATLIKAVLSFRKL